MLVCACWDLTNFKATTAVQISPDQEEVMEESARRGGAALKIDLVESFLQRETIAWNFSSSAHIVQDLKNDPGGGGNTTSPTVSPQNKQNGYRIGYERGISANNRATCVRVR